MRSRPKYNIKKKIILNYMTVKTFESEFHDGLYITFKNYYDFEHIEKAIKKNDSTILLKE
ncbi:MAG: hypothetical protein P8Y70_16905 [Candidatus Lokiarchaeota archaeon]